MAGPQGQTPNRSIEAQTENDDSGVPISERGKGENMLWDKRHPTWVFSLVAGTFFVMLIVALLGMIAYMGM